MLTVQQATKQARRHVDKLMPGVMATVESRLTADADLNPIVRTSVTWPAGHAASVDLALALTSLKGYRGDLRGGECGYSFTRTR